MKDLKNLLGKYQAPVQKKTTITNRRQEIIGEFLERINAERKPPYKPLTAPRVAKLLSPIKGDGNLYAFLAECKDRKSFSKYFWWSVNPAKHKTITLDNILKQC